MSDAAAVATMGVSIKRPRETGISGGMAHRRYPMDEGEPTPRQRGPYKGRVAKLSYEERLELRRVERPHCKCGCGTLTRWLSTRGRWAVYANGHYRQAAPYKDAAWLREQYDSKRLTMAEIAALCGVNPSLIAKFMKKFGIERRDRSESRIGRKPGALNPAWKGGVADWDYAAGWKVIARKIRDRDEWTCQLCGDQRKRWGRDLHVHHIDEDKLNNDRLNLISLCAGCHPRGSRALELASELRDIAAQNEGVI